MEVPVPVNEVCVLYVCLLGMEWGLAGSSYEDCVLQGFCKGRSYFVNPK